MHASAKNKNLVKNIKTKGKHLQTSIKHCKTSLKIQKHSKERTCMKTITKI